MSTLPTEPSPSSASGTAPEMARLDRWLQGIWQLLAPVQPAALAIVRVSGLGGRVEWQDEAIPGDHILHAYPSGSPATFGGWLIGLGTREGAGLGLLLRTTPDLPRGATELKLAASLCRAGFGLLWPADEGTKDSAVEEGLHELRNALNCAAMSVTLLTGPQLPLELRGHADDTRNAIDRSIRALRNLASRIKE